MEALEKKFKNKIDSRYSKKKIQTPSIYGTESQNLNRNLSHGGLMK